MPEILHDWKARIGHWLFWEDAGIHQEYEAYRLKHAGEGRIGKLKAWAYALGLNVRYRTARRLAGRRSEADATPQNDQYAPVSESHSSYRQSPLSLAITLNKYDVISFDIFDTLILRPFDQPATLFYLLEAKLDCSYAAVRVAAEREARELARERTGSTEVTIEEICACVARRTGLDAARCVQMEFEAEMAMCFANPYMKKVFDALKEQGKEIIIVSDMYLPRDMMVRLLEKCGYTGMKKVYVSCDYKVNKREKGLYEIVRGEIGAEKRVVHIGDNEQSDVQSAQEAGWEAIHYHNVNHAGARFRPQGMSNIIGSAYAGLVNAQMHNGLRSYSPYYEYGFIYGGLYVTGFCHWIRKRMRQEGIEKVLFLSRDGMVYKRVFDRLFPDVPSEYVYWSRIASMRYCTDINRNEYILRMVRHKVNSPTPVTLLGILRACGTECLTEEIHKAGMNEWDVLTKENVDAVAQIFVDHWDAVMDAYEAETQRYARILREQIGDSRKVAVVDVGWAGSGPLGVKYFVEKKMGLACSVYGFMAGSSTTDYAKTEVAQLTGELDSYIFSQMHNRELYENHMRSNRSTNCLYFEIFTQACQPSFKGVEEDGTFAFSLPEVENYRIIDEIHQGIEAFAALYTRTFAEYPFMFTISGRDAYMPFRRYIGDLQLVRRDFLDFAFARGVGSDEATQRVETLREQLESLELLEKGASKR